MLLENKYFNVIRQDNTDSLNATFRIALLPDCEVYKGHFPGEPICPGVCNIETIKECASMLLGRELRYSAIKQCRLTAIATPQVCPEVDITIALTERDGEYGIQSTISDEKQTYMILKGTLV